MSWFDKLMPKIKSRAAKKSVPEGLWHKCDSCGAVLYATELQKNLSVCPKCNYHMRIGARERLRIFLDGQTQFEIGGRLSPIDVLKFKDTKKYKDRISDAQKTTGEKDALVAVRG